MIRIFDVRLDIINVLLTNCLFELTLTIDYVFVEHITLNTELMQKFGTELKSV